MDIFNCPYLYLMKDKAGLPDIILNEVERELSNKFGESHTIDSVEALSGGSINSSYELVFQNEKRFFIKYNVDALYPEMFEKEANGLNLLRETATIRIPEVIFTGKAAQFSYLVLQMVKPGSISKTFFKDLGIGLAQMHNNSSKLFGLNHNNYIGSISQLNTQKNNFSDFFIEMRLEPLAQKAIKAGLLPGKIHEGLEILYSKLDNLIPRESPALLHGDLWSGNRLIGPDGNAWLIDPAIYYGHRETDLSMTLLFHGFDADFYRSYNEHFPLELGWKERVEIHNLYPLLVHLNLFGTNYLPQIMQVVGKYL